MIPRMTIHLSLRNWRSIEHAEVALDAMNVLVGRNATGKSNLCDSLMFFREIATDASSAVSRRGGITSVRRWSPMKPYDVELQLRLGSSKGSLSHSLSLSSGREGDWHFKREIIEIITPAESIIVSRKANKVTIQRQRQGPPTSRSVDVDESLEIEPTTSAMLLTRQLVLPRPGRVWTRDIAGFRTLRPSPELMRIPQQPTERVRLESTADNIASALASLQAPTKQRVVALMQKIVPELVDVKAVSSGRYQSVQFEQRLSDKRPAEFTATEMSDGALRALALIVAAEQNEDGQLLIVEEPEVNLHPGASSVVFDALRGAAKRGTVLVTTHSPEILDLAARDNILVADYHDGVTSIGPLAEKQHRVVREGLLTVSELVRTDALRREGVTPQTVTP
jgi:type I restriction enzyme M protein